MDRKAEERGDEGTGEERQVTKGSPGGKRWENMLKIIRQAPVLCATNRCTRERESWKSC